MLSSALAFAIYRWRSAEIRVTGAQMSAAARSTNQEPLVAAQPALARQLDEISVNIGKGVTIVSGFPASGKSTAARYLADLVDAVIVDKDAFAPNLEEAVMAELTGDRHDRDSDVYVRVVSPHIYSSFIEQALLVGHRIPIIVDAPFLEHICDSARQRISLADYIRATATVSVPQIRTIWISADPNQIRERMTRRNAARDAGKLSDWNTYRSNVLDSNAKDLAHTVTDYVVIND
jgi:predicted kinase